MLGILPLFGFVSAGVTIDGASQLLQPLPIGVAMGLFLGKQLGVFGAVWLADRSGIAPKPAGVGWSQLYGAAMLCGIGFTMSLFIGGLAFPGQPELADEAKLGTMAGSILSAIAGALVLRLAAPATPPPPADQREWDAVFAGSDEH